MCFLHLFLLSFLYLFSLSFLHLFSPRKTCKNSHKKDRIFCPAFLISRFFSIFAIFLFLFTLALKIVAILRPRSHEISYCKIKDVVLCTFSSARKGTLRKAFWCTRWLASAAAVLPILAIPWAATAKWTQILITTCLIFT